MQAEYGEHQYGRIDLHMPEAQKNAAIARARALKPGDPVFAGMAISRQENLDGVKFYLDNPEAEHPNPTPPKPGCCSRASGTEPLHAHLRRIVLEGIRRQAPRLRARLRAWRVIFS